MVVKQKDDCVANYTVPFLLNFADVFLEISIKDCASGLGGNSSSLLLSVLSGGAEGRTG